MALEFEYRLTGAGWSAARIADGTSTAQLTASYLSDALGNLVGAVAAIVDGELEARCSWDEEPGEYRWIFVRHGDHVRLEILWFDELWGGCLDEDGRLVFLTNQSVHDLGWRILASAQDVLDRHGLEGYRETWIEHDFPDGPLERLRHGLRSRR